MSGGRIDRFLASTAVVLVLTSAAAGSALAEPKLGSNVIAAAVVDAPTVVAQAAQPVEPATEPAMEAAATPVESKESADASAVAVVKPDDVKPDDSADRGEMPATTPDEPVESVSTIPAPAPVQSTETPAAPAAAPVQSTETPAALPAEASAMPAPDTEAMPAAAPEPAAAPAAVADANTPIVEQLRELANGKLDRVVGKKDRPAYDALYASRNYAPIWITDGAVNARAKVAMAYLAHVDADGLDPADYPVPDFSARTDAASLAEAELKLSTILVTYAHHAATGRVHWSRVNSNILYDVKTPTPAEVLAGLADATDVSVALAAYEPQAPGYIALKEKLAELRGGKADAGKTPIPNGPAPRIGASDDRVPELRDRLHIGGDGTIYDKAVADAVKKFQQEHEMRPTGLLTPQTIEALNGREPDRPIDTILANMERWRWMPHDLGQNYVIVNLPDFTLRVFQNGQQVWMTKIVTGKPGMPTPIMTAEMKYITVNPTWNVPPSIVMREYLPALAQDPTVLARMGLRVSSNPDGSVHISQPPGERNALGRLRFNFPNKFLVYQHDTPDKNLFALSKRAFSHGCMRVENPAKYAEVLLNITRPGEGYTEDRIRGMFGRGEQDIQFPKFLPVHITYQTAFVDNGKLEFREDMYGRDAVLLAILKGDERRMADGAVERRDAPTRRSAAMPGQQNLFGNGWGGWGGTSSYATTTSRSYYQGGGGGFFSQMFGAPNAAPGIRRRSSLQ